MFLEHWSDTDALRVHFAVAASNEFVRQARALSSSATAIWIFEASLATL